MTRTGFARRLDPVVDEPDALILLSSDDFITESYIGSIYVEQAAFIYSTTGRETRG